jgi:hypothetical protein
VSGRSSASKGADISPLFFGGSSPASPRHCEDRDVV